MSSLYYLTRAQQLGATARKHFPSLSKREVILAFTIKERMPSQAEKVTLKLTINTVHNIPNAEFSNQISFNQAWMATLHPPSSDGNTALKPGAFGFHIRLSYRFTFTAAVRRRAPRLRLCAARRRRR